jgi:hypothetical protein
MRRIKSQRRPGPPSYNPKWAVLTSLLIQSVIAASMAAQTIGKFLTVHISVR